MFGSKSISRTLTAMAGALLLSSVALGAALGPAHVASASPAVTAHA